MAGSSSARSIDVDAIAMTRRPAAASDRTRSAAVSSGKSSGAPRTKPSSPSRIALHFHRDENGIDADGVVWASGKASASACSVELRTVEAAAYRPKASRSSSVLAAAGSSETTRRRGSVSVPVLSVQTTSADARDSTALSCCTSAPWREILSAPVTYTMLASRIRPSGMRLIAPATTVLKPSSNDDPRSHSAIDRAVTSGMLMTTSVRMSRPRPRLERGSGMAERPRLAGDALGVAVGADRRHGERARCPRPRTHRRARRRRGPSRPDPIHRSAWTRPTGGSRLLPPHRRRPPGLPAAVRPGRRPRRPPPESCAGRRL